MPPASPAVQVDGLVKRYGRREAVRGVDLAAAHGAVTALLGPNGAGKTTTVECCEGLRRPDGGTVRVLGLDPVRDAARLRPRVGVMLQDGGLPATAPAGDVLAHVARLHDAPRPVGELVDRLGLGGVLRTPVRRLSGGERQRVALAAAVVGRPEVVFLDEPGAGLDPHARLAVWDLVTELREDGAAVLLTTHQMAEAEALAQHVVVVDDGRVVADGTVDRLVGGDAGVHVVVRPADDGATPVTQGHARTWALALAVAVRAVRPGGGEADVTAELAAGGVRLEVPGAADPAVLHAVTGWARDEGLLVTSLTTGRRTLEDVFLELTGRSLR